MKNLIAFAAAVAVNLAVLGSLNSDLLTTQAAPAGVVTIEQLPEAQLVASVEDGASAGAVL